MFSYDHKMNKTLLVSAYCLLSCINTTAQDVPIPKDTILKGNGEKIVCFIKSYENDRVQYLTGGRFLTTTYTQRLSRIIFGDGTLQEFQPVIRISSDADWEKVKVVADPGKVKNLVELGVIDIEKQGSLFTKQEKIRTALIEQIKKESSKLGAHMVLIVDADNSSGGIDWDGERIIGIRPGAKISAIAYGF